MQWHEKFAFPLIAAIVVCLGAPFAFLVGTRGAIGGLALAVGIGIVYRAARRCLNRWVPSDSCRRFSRAGRPTRSSRFLAVYFFLKMPT